MSLCQTCSTKSTLNVPGACQKCSGITSHFAHALCDPCSTQLDECEWCRAPLQAGSSSPIASAAGVFYTTCRDKDKGKTFKNLSRGEQIHVILPEDQYAWKEWNVKRPLNYQFKLISRGQFTPDNGNPQYGTREFIFEIVNTGLASIEFEECQRTWSWGWGNTGSSIGQAIPGGQTWDANFDVK